MCIRSLISVPTEPNKPNNYNMLCGFEAMHVKLIYPSSFQVIMESDNFERGLVYAYIYL